MAGRIIDGIEYVGLMHNNDFKNKSLEDNIYFTLRDIFWNGECNDCLTANHFNRLLTNDLRFEDRTASFKYSNILNDYDSIYIKQLYKFLVICNCNNNLFHFEEPNKEDEIDQEYMPYTEWKIQLQKLIRQIEIQIEKLEGSKYENSTRKAEKTI